MVLIIQSRKGSEICKEKRAEIYALRYKGEFETLHMKLMILTYTFIEGKSYF